MSEIYVGALRSEYRERHVEHQFLEDSAYIGDCRVDRHMNGTMMANVTTVAAKMLARDIRSYTITHPEGWLDHVKERWFPRWALRRWPARYVTHRITASEYIPFVKHPNGVVSVRIQTTHMKGGNDEC